MKKQIYRFSRLFSKIFTNFRKNVQIQMIDVSIIDIVFIDIKNDKLFASLFVKNDKFFALLSIKLIIIKRQNFIKQHDFHAQVFAKNFQILMIDISMYRLSITFLSIYQLLITFRSILKTTKKFCIVID